MDATTMYPKRCRVCGGWMEFEILYCAGNPIVTWRCCICNTLSSYALYVATDRTYVDKDYRTYYVDTTNIQEGAYSGETVWRDERTYDQNQRK